MTDRLLQPVWPDTPRLRLRAWQASDWAPFAALNADPAVMACFPRPLSRAESDALAQRCQGLIAGRGWGVWAVERLEDRCFIGCVGLHEPAATLPFSPCVEIAWRLARDCWGQGYATEAAEAALERAFGALSLAEVVAFTADVNQRSLALMQRLGMRDSGAFAHPDLPPGHRLRPHRIYRITRLQWLQQSVRSGVNR